MHTHVNIVTSFNPYYAVLGMKNQIKADYQFPEKT